MPVRLQRRRHAHHGSRQLRQLAVCVALRDQFRARSRFSSVYSPVGAITILKGVEGGGRLREDGGRPAIVTLHQQ